MPRRRLGLDAPLTHYARRPLSFILRYIAGRPVAHATILLSVIAAVGCAVASQYAVKHLVDTLAKGPSAPVWQAFLILTALIATDNLSWRLGGWVATYGFVGVTGDIRRELFIHLTGHSPAYFADRMPGMLASRISSTGQAVFTVENTISWNVLPPCLAVLGSIAVMMTVSPFMALTLVVLSGALAWWLSRLAERGQPLHNRFATDAARVDGELVDVINNMPLVRAFGATLRERERFASRLDREMRARGRSLRYLERLRLVHAAATALLTAGLLAWAILLFKTGRATTGDVVLVSTLGFTILHGTRDLAVALVDTIQHVARLSEALSTLLLPHDMLEAEAARALSGPRGCIELRRVTFRYANGATVLDDLSLRIEPGERVGLVGRSGSGKSTLLTLIQRLVDPQQGCVLIDGEDVRLLTQQSLRDAISIVPQDVSLFHRSILENIRYGKPGASDEEVRAASDAAGCRDFLSVLPDGFDTVVGDRGAKLSGGQRQRIAIARAFLRNAPILLLDEATSALDSESERTVQCALERLMVGRTVVAVAHRLATLRDFDRIVVLQSGRILQDGAPAELERHDGIYRDMLSRQAVGIAA